MLTPAQIRSHEFPTVGRGAYRSIDVDEFMSEVAEAFESLERERTECIRKISALNERVESYRKEEENISRAILVAQKAASGITEEANREAERVLGEANSRAEAAVAAAQKEADETLGEIGARADAIMADAEAKARKSITEADIQSRDKMHKADSYYSGKIEAADAKAAKTIADADEYSAGTIARADRELAVRQRTIDELKEEVDAFRRNLLTLYTEHIELIQRLPMLAEQEINEPVQAAPAQEEETQPEEKAEDKAAEEQQEAEPAFDILDGADGMAYDEAPAGENEDVKPEDDEFNIDIDSLFADEEEAGEPEVPELTETADEPVEEPEADETASDVADSDGDDSFGFTIDTFSDAEEIADIPEDKRPVDFEQPTEVDLTPGARGFAIAEEIAEGEEDSFEIKSVDDIGGSSGNVTRNGTIYEVVNDIDDDDDDDDGTDNRDSFFRGFNKKK